MANQNFAVQILINARDQASKVVGQLTGSVTKLTAGITAAIAALSGWAFSKLFGDSVDAAEALERQMGKLRGAITATGGAAGLTAEEIDTMARRLDEAGLGAADAFRDAAAELLTFKSVGRDVFERTLALSQDLADTGFGSVESAAVMMGKALEDPVKGLTALGRVGVTFTDGQRALIGQFVAMGDTAKAQGVILDAVAGQVEGVSSAMGSGLSGAIDLAGKRLTDLKEQLGQGMLPVLTAFYNKIADLYKQLTESGAVREFGDILAAAFGKAIDAGLNFLSTLDFKALLQRVQDFAAQAGPTLVGWGQTLADLADRTQSVMTAMSAAWNGLRGTIETIGQIIAKAIALPMQAYATVTAAAERLGIVSEEWAGKVRAAADSMSEASRNYGEAAKQHFTEAGTALGLLGDAHADVTRSSDALTDAYADQEAKLQALIYAEEAQAIALGGNKKAVEDLRTPVEQLSQQINALEIAYKAFMSVGDVQGAARIRSEIEELKKSLKEAKDQADVTATAVIEAFARMGIQTKELLGRTRDQAKADFEVIKASGQATPQGIQEAFTQYAEAAVAANGGVVDSTLQIKAAQQGLAVIVSETGQVQVQSAEAAAEAERRLAEQTREATDAGREQAAAAEDTAAAVVNVASNVASFDRSAAQSASVTRTWSQTMKSAGVDLEALGDYADVAEQKFKEVYETLRGMDASRGILSYDLYAHQLRTIGERAAAAAVRAAALARAADELDAKLSALNGRYVAGDLSLTDYIAKLERMERTYARLGDERLEGLRDAIRDAKREMEDFTDSTESGLASLQIEWARLNDQQGEVLRLQYLQDQMALQAQLAVAKAQGNQAAIKALQEQLRLLEAIYEKRLDAINAEEEAARKQAEENAAAESSTATESTAVQPSQSQSVAVLPVRVVDIRLSLPSGRSETVQVVEGGEAFLEHFMRELERAKSVAL
ncbi:phage tail length tape measure family protein [Imhoffiella purpurea]|uniref:Bacteriophage tail tape measure N-terminal domain-containing protein n=1 Tax=Imhoffiella purpurea TaxID=1249627 RepID=W9VB19_9GAMM|nr:phage tail length tape measure family protein [Imhoffiella purpurea]EXJ13242.1 hypothetical protein D779_3920 [Imhoffiella purpurea]